MLSGKSTRSSSKQITPSFSLISLNFSIHRSSAKFPQPLFVNYRNSTRLSTGPTFSSFGGAQLNHFIQIYAKHTQLDLMKCLISVLKPRGKTVTASDECPARIRNFAIGFYSFDSGARHCSGSRNDGGVSAAVVSVFLRKKPLVIWLINSTNATCH